jgi:hypothetical protein
MHGKNSDKEELIAANPGICAGSVHRPQKKKKKEKKKN